MPNRKKIALAFPILLLAYAANGQKLSTPGLKPVWTLDLRQNPEYASREERQTRQSLGHVAANLPRPQLAFLSNNTIAISFHDASWQDFPPDHLEDFHFRTVMVNTSTGKLEQRSLAWPTPDDDSVLLPMHDGGFVAIAGKQILRYSPDFKVEVQSPMPADSGNDSIEEFGYYPQSKLLWQKTHWYAREDPQQAIVLLTHATPNGIRNFWLDGNTLQVMASAAYEDLRGWASFVSVSQNAIAQDRGSEPFLIRRDGSAQQFCPNYGNATAMFVSNDKVLVLHHINKKPHYLFVTPDCHLLTDASGEDPTFLVATAAAGNRFAVNTGKFGQLYIHVWDLNPPKEILYLPIRRSDSHAAVDIGFSDSAEALSPDGKYLAVLVDFTLAVYAISP